MSELNQRHSVAQEGCGTVGVMLANPNTKAVIIDRPEGGPAFVMALSVDWNQIRERLRYDLDLTK